MLLKNLKADSHLFRIFYILLYTLQYGNIEIKVT